MTTYIMLLLNMVIFADVRGETARKEYNILLRLKKKVAQEKLDEQLTSVVQIQSGKPFSF